jgi:mono/diheme cytochrome c family protein
MADGASPIEQMNFADGKWSHGDSIADITKVITDGAPGTAMLSFKSQLTPEEIAGLAKYVRSFDKTPPKASGTAKKATKPAPKTK